MLALFGQSLLAAVQVESLGPSIPSPQVVGTSILWTASAKVDGKPAALYQFAIRFETGAFTPVRDFSPEPSFVWTPTESDGSYTVRVIAKDPQTRETATRDAVFTVSAAVNNTDAVRATKHPLVALFSAPVCREGSRMRVKYASYDSAERATPWKDCNGRSTMNFLVAGMFPESNYQLWFEREDGSNVFTGPQRFFRTGVARKGLPEGLVTRSSTALGGVPADVTYSYPLFDVPFATDMRGRLLWYGLSTGLYATRSEPNGYYWTMDVLNRDLYRQTARLWDLAGNILLELNVGAINLQLVEKGLPAQSGIHHDIHRLADGSIVMLGAVEKLTPYSTGTLPVNVLADTIIVLDKDLKLKWFWNAFDHLSPNTEAAIFLERCAQGVCSPLYLGDSAEDWTHANSVTYTPDGHLLMSIRHLDWVIKINYDNGKGDGKILWRLGDKGDFQLVGGDSTQWFSHQHDASYVPGTTNRVMLFDNSNDSLRVTVEPQSRGQVYEIDEIQRTARPVVNTMAGTFSFALGSAQLLPSGNYLFNSGWYLGTIPFGQVIEVDPNGRILFDMRLPRYLYRSYRWKSLYER